MNCGDGKATCDSFQKSCTCVEGGQCSESSFETIGCPCTLTGKSDFNVGAVVGVTGGVLATILGVVVFMFKMGYGCFSARRAKMEANKHEIRMQFVEKAVGIRDAVTAKETDGVNRAMAVAGVAAVGEACGGMA